MLNTSEGELEEEGNKWYDTPRNKRKRTMKPKVKPTRRSPRFTKEQVKRLDDLSEVANHVREVEHQHPSLEQQEQQYGLGLNRTMRDRNVFAPKSKNVFEPIPQFRSPKFITQEALNMFAFKAMTDPSLYSSARMHIDPPKGGIVDLEHFCAPVIHPTSGKLISKYKELANDPETMEVWIRAFGKEFGGLAQGDNLTGEKGTDAIFVMNHDQIKNIPAGKTITYGRLVVDYRPQKEDPNRVRLTAGGNLITCDMEVTTKTADLTTSKIMWNSVVSTALAKYMCIDIKNFYLCAPMKDYEYMKMPLSIFPAHIVEQYDLNNKAKNGQVYLECRRAIYGLPQAGRLANDYLKEKLAPAGYYEVPHTPGLWKHISRPIEFTLVVDDFGVKYVGIEHVNHLIAALKKYFTIAEDWTGSLYCGITLKWDYEKRIVDILMPGYIKKVLQRYSHEKPKKHQACPYPVEPRKYGRAAQDPMEQDTSRNATEKETKKIQKVVGSILYYARGVDSTALVSLSTIASEQAKATGHTIATTEQLLDYMASNPDATIRFYASDMILNIHSDASYLSVRNARSRAGGHFFLGWMPKNGEDIKLNGAIFTLSTILKFVAASAAEAELGALFLCVKHGRIIRLVLEELGHPQPATPINCDNATAVGISNGTVKMHRSRSMEMNYFYTCDQVKVGNFTVNYHPGKENMGDYPSKNHEARQHIHVRPLYVHMDNSPRVLPRALKPSDLRGCVGTKAKMLAKQQPAPLFPRYI